MLDSLKVKNFRMLADLEIPKLGNVNLIVGKNNSGKSSLLEALRIYATKGNPRALQEIANSHGELALLVPRSDGETEEVSALPFRDFFSGREFPAEDTSPGIYIGNVGETDFVRINHALYVDEYEKISTEDGEETSRKRRRMISKDDLGSDALVAEQALAVSLSDVPHLGWIPLSEVLSSSGTRRQAALIFWERFAKEIPVSVVPTHFLSIDYLAQLWDSILFSPYADEVKASLKILDDDFEDLAFVKTGIEEYRNDRIYRLSRFRVPYSDRTAVVKLRSSSTSIPLSSMGDGMLRVLQLALTVFPSKGGVLLIDEFENGLHWSVQEKIWEMIFTLANDLEIQVFATTHSEDAVKAFSKVASERPEVGVLVKLVSKKLPEGRDKTIGVIYDEATLKTATMTETEVR